MTAGRPWSLWDPDEIIPKDGLTSAEQEAVADWLQRLAHGPANVDSVHLPSGPTVASHYPPEHEDYEAPLPENLFLSRIPHTRWECRFEVHYGPRTIHIVGFERGP